MGIEVCKMVSGLEKGTKQIVTVCPRAEQEPCIIQWSRQEAGSKGPEGSSSSHEELLAKEHGEHEEISLSLSLDFRAISMRRFGKWGWLGADSTLQGAVQILICLFKGSAMATSGGIKADVDGSLVYILCDCPSLFPQGNWSNRATEYLVKLHWNLWTEIYTPGCTSR